MSTHKKASTKASLVTKILSRERGATLIEMSKATGWQPHSCRAFLTGLRKKGTILKEQRNDGQLAYRITPAALQTAQAETASAE